MKKTLYSFLLKWGVSSSVVVLAACGDVSYVQKESPANLYKDYRRESASVVGVGDPISKNQMRANATFSAKGRMSLDKAMKKVANVYNLAVRWGAGVHKETVKDMLISQLTFDEARNYIEDVYDVQIVREGDRRLLILPSIHEVQIDEFSPGVNTLLSQVVRGLGEQCGYNLVITENKQVLSSTFVTTSLHNISCTDAFDAVLSPYGLALNDEGGYYSIGGLPQESWIVNLYEPIRSETQEVNYSSTVDSGGGSGGSSGGASSGGSASISTSNERNLWEELEIDLSTLVDKSCAEYEANAQSAAMPALLPQTVDANGNPVTLPQNTFSTASTASGSFECGYVRVNSTVGLIQMRAPRKILNEAASIIAQVEDVASRRLLVEARILAVTRSRNFAQGAKIGSSLGEIGDDTIGAGFAPTLNSVTTSLTGRLLGLVTGETGGVFAFQGNNLDAAVKLTEEYGTTYQLMQPTIEVMDRQRAMLIDGRNEKYFVIQKDTNTVNGVIVETQTAEERSQFVGIQFSVTAQIAEEGDLHTVSLQVPITEISRFVTIPDGSNSQVPVVTSRIIDQKVRLRDGEIKVVGGLTRTIAIDKESGIPLIRGIPMAGKLFNEEDIDYEDVEFLVLLQVRRVF